MLAVGVSRCREPKAAHCNLCPNLRQYLGDRDPGIYLSFRAASTHDVIRTCHGARAPWCAYGLFRDIRRVAGATEEGLFQTLGLDWIPPELREDRGEIEAARRHVLPRLIERADLLGDLHVHTNESDGSGSRVAMAQAARANGLRYIAITDHSKYVGITHGLDAARLSAQIDSIDALNATLNDLVILKSVEVDILEDGRLALPDALLGRLDLVVASIHSHFDLPESRQTTRILRALERPFVSILGHPFGRRLGERSPCVFNYERVLDAARDRPCFTAADWEEPLQPVRVQAQERRESDER